MAKNAPKGNRPNQNKGQNPAAAKGKPQGAPKQPKQGRNEFEYLNLPGNKQLHKETTAATNLAYRPTERSIGAEKRASVQRTKNEGTWWNEYLAQVGAGQQATKGAYEAAAGQTQGIINTAGAVDSANTAGMNSEAAANAAARGQSATAANAATTGTANAAQATRNAGIASLGARTAGQGANEFAYLGEQKRIGAGQRVNAMTNQAKKTASIEGDRTALRKERGEYAVKTLGQKQAEAREIKLKKQAFALEKHSAAQSAKAEAEAAKIAYTEHLAEQRERGEERAEGRTQQTIENEQAAAGLGISKKKLTNEEATEKYEREHPNAGTPAEKRESKEGRTNALSTVHAFIASHGYPESPAARAELEREVAKESEVSPADARWAVKRYLERNPNTKFDGRLSPGL